MNISNLVLILVLVTSAAAEDQTPNRTPADAAQSNAQNCPTCNLKKPGASDSVGALQKVAEKIQKSNDDQTSCRIQIDVSSAPCSSADEDQKLYKSIWPDSFVGKTVITQEEVAKRALTVLHFGDADVAAYQKKFGKDPLPKLYEQSDLLAYQSFITQCRKAQLIYKGSPRSVTDTYVYPVGPEDCRKLRSFVSDRHFKSDLTNSIAFGSVEGADSIIVKVELPDGIEKKSATEFSDAVMNALGLDSQAIIALEQGQGSEKEKQKLKDLGVDPAQFRKWMTDFEVELGAKRNTHPKWFSWGQDGPEIRVKMPIVASKEGQAPLHWVMGQVAMDRIDASADKDLQAKWAKSSFPSIRKFLDLCVDPIEKGATSVFTDDYANALGAFLKYGASQDERDKIDSGLLQKASEMSRELAAKGTIRKTSRCYSLASTISRLGTQMGGAIVAGILGGEVGGAVGAGSDIEGLGVMTAADAMQATAVKGATRIEQNGLLVTLATDGASSQARTIFAEGSGAAVFSTASLGSSYKKARDSGASDSEAITSGLTSMFVTQALFQLGSGAAQGLRLATGIEDAAQAAGKKGMTGLAAKAAKGLLTTEEKRFISAKITTSILEAANTCTQMSLLSVIDDTISSSPNSDALDILNKAKAGCKSGLILHVANSGLATGVNGAVTAVVGKPEVKVDSVISAQDGKFRVTKIDKGNNEVTAISADGKVKRIYNLRAVNKILAENPPEKSGAPEVNVAHSEKFKKAGDKWLDVAKKGDQVYYRGEPVFFVGKSTDGTFSVQLKDKRITVSANELNYEPIQTSRTAGTELISRLKSGSMYQRNDQVLDRETGTKLEVVDRSADGSLTVKDIKTGKVKTIKESEVKPDSRMNDPEQWKQIQQYLATKKWDTDKPNLTPDQMVMVATALRAQKGADAYTTIERLVLIADKETRPKIIEAAYGGRTDYAARLSLKQLTDEKVEGAAQALAKYDDAAEKRKAEPAVIKYTARNPASEKVRTHLILQAGLTEEEAGVVAEALDQMSADERGQISDKLQDGLNTDPSGTAKKLRDIRNICEKE